MKFPEEFHTIVQHSPVANGCRFAIHLTRRAKKFLDDADKDLYDRMIVKIERLADDPFPSDAKRILGQKEKMFRVRVGDYRVLYIVFFEKNTVLVVNIDKRAKVYN